MTDFNLIKTIILGFILFLVSENSAIKNLESMNNFKVNYLELTFQEEIDSEKCEWSTFKRFFSKLFKPGLCAGSKFIKIIFSVTSFKSGSPIQPAHPDYSLFINNPLFNYHCDLLIPDHHHRNLTNSLFVNISDLKQLRISKMRC